MVYCSQRNGFPFYRPNQTQGGPRSDPGGGQNLCGDHKRRPAGSPAQIFAIFKRGINGKGEGLREPAEICTKERGSDSR